MWATVQGYCPMGCGQTLFLGSGGFVTCSLDVCPNPTALSDIIRERETEHVVELHPEAFSVQHPLRERLDGLLFDCTLHRDIAASDGPPALPGRYRVTTTNVKRYWERLGDATGDPS